MIPSPPLDSGFGGDMNSKERYMIRKAKAVWHVSKVPQSPWTPN